MYPYVNVQKASGYTGSQLRRSKVEISESSWIAGLKEWVKLSMKNTE